ncbi:MAG TPA: hypothetical protein PKJ62_05695, partial [Bacteroidia bacterium]|nr:hypothetical protein [Bacteroidia bacterium]
MNSLNYLKSILKTLNQQELNSLEKFVLYQGGKDEVGVSKTTQLIKLVLDSGNFSSIDIQKTIYGKLNYSAFNKLANRLKERILEVILFNSSIRSSNYAERSKTIFELRKRMIQVDLLILKGVRSKVIDELNLIIKKADDYEIYDVLIQALYTKQRTQSFDMGLKRFEKHKMQIKLAEEKWIAFNSAQLIFNIIVSKIGAVTKPELYKIELQEALLQLNERYRKTYAPTVGYYYHLLQVEYFQLEKDYLKADVQLKELVKLVENSKSVYSDFRIGSVKMNLANNCIFLKDFESAILNIEDAKHYFRNQAVNLTILKEIELYVYFYLGELSICNQLSEDLILESRKVNSPLVSSKIIYLSASIDFVMSEFSKALIRLDECEEIDKDKEGWNIIKKIMILICRIELGEFESVDLKLG